MRVYTVNIFDKETNALVDTTIFLTWKSAELLNEGYTLTCSGEPLYFRCPKEN